MRGILLYQCLPPVVPRQTCPNTTFVLKRECVCHRIPVRFTGSASLHCARIQLRNAEIDSAEQGKSSLHTSSCSCSTMKCEHNLKLKNLKPVYVCTYKISDFFIPEEKLLQPVARLLKDIWKIHSYASVCSVYIYICMYSYVFLCMCVYSCICGVMPTCLFTFLVLK